MKWNRVIDGLPVIPEGKFGLQVIVADFDACYDEINPGKGHSVHSLRFAYVDYKRMPDFIGSIYKDGEPAFMDEMTDGNGKRCGMSLPGDEVTHWMYYPVPPEYDPEVLNPIFQWYHDHAVPQSPLKQISKPEWTIEQIMAREG